MAPQSSRYYLSAVPPRRSRPAKSFRLRCEPLEGRIAPALFNVSNPVTVSGTANYGCLATGDFNNDGNTDMVLTNYGTTAPGQGGSGP